MKPTLTPLLAALSLMIAGCSGIQSAHEPGRGGQNLITSEQMVGASAESVYNAVERLRPEWLSTRGPTSIRNPNPPVPSVFIGGVHVGDVEYLRRVLADDVLEIRYFDAAQAGARFGMGHLRGVIEVVMKGGRGGT